MATNKDLLYFLDNYYLDAKCELNYNSIFSLLIAVMLSAQTTDVSVNKVTPTLFEKYPTIKSLAEANINDVIPLINKIGLAKNKSKNITETAKIIHEKYNDEVPNTLEELTTLPGVGRKTASVVLIEGFKKEAFPVDTHVMRVSKRLGYCEDNDDAFDTEMKLRAIIPSEKLAKAHHQLIIFGRYQCKAKNPSCKGCYFNGKCRLTQK